MLRLSTLALAAVLLSFTASATTWTVSNNPNKPAQYTSLQTAIDSAAIGDTLLISGSPTSYGTINLNKQLHLIGEGIGSSVDNPSTGTFNLVNQDATVNASGSTVEGLDMSSVNVGYYGSVPVEDVTIKRCRFNVAYFGAYTNGVSKGSKNIYLNQCLIRDYLYFSDSQHWLDNGGASDGEMQNIVVENCVFDGQSSYHLHYVGDCNGELELRNCMFLSTSQGLISSSYDLSEAVFENCLFFGTQFPDNITNCLFNNCLAYQGDDTLPPGDEAANNTGSNNLSATDPLFVSYNATPVNHSWDHDYTLQEGSLAIGAGLDGVDIGIGGGSISSFDGNLPHTPRGPVVTSINLPVTAVAVGGTLQINVSAESRD